MKVLIKTLNVLNVRDLGPAYIYNENTMLLTHKVDLAKQYEEHEADKVIKQMKKLGYKYKFHKEDVWSMAG